MVCSFTVATATVCGTPELWCSSSGRDAFKHRSTWRGRQLVGRCRTWQASAARRRRLTRCARGSRASSRMYPKIKSPPRWRTLMHDSSTAGSATSYLCWSSDGPEQNLSGRSLSQKHQRPDWSARHPSRMTGQRQLPRAYINGPVWGRPCVGDFPICG